MMRLWIMRHGEAGSAHSDAERPLTAAGEAQARQSGRWLASQLSPAELLVVIHSPLRRARQSAMQVVEALAQCGNAATAPQLLESERLTLESSASELIEWLTLQQWQGSWLLVSHMPLVATLTGQLQEGSRHLGSPFATAQIVGLDADVWASGCASYAASFTPART